MALTIDIADAVVAELAGGTFTEPFTPVRRVRPEYELSDLKELRVTVVPAAVEIGTVSRAMTQHDVRIDVGVQKKLGPAIDDEVATLCGLVEQIAEFLKRRTLAAKPQAIWLKSANEPIYAADHLAEQRTFTSVLSLTYRVLS